MKKGDKIIMINKICGFGEVNDIYIVEDVVDGIISFKSENGGFSGGVSADIFEKYFKKVEEPKEDCEFSDYEDYVDMMIFESEIEVADVFNDKGIVVACKLPSGFVMTESYFYANPEDHNEEDAVDNCLFKIRERLLEMEAYRSHQDIWEYEIGDEESCDGDCENCPYDENNNEESDEKEFWND